MQKQSKLRLMSEIFMQFRTNKQLEKLTVLEYMLDTKVTPDIQKLQ